MGAEPTSLSGIGLGTRVARDGGNRSGQHRESRWTWNIGSIAGIQLHLHITFVALILWLALAHLTAGHGLVGMTGAIAVNLAIFTTVVLHELGHALVARRYGIRTRDITLWPIGGIARLERMPDDPRQEILVAVAGPAVNLVIAALLLGTLLVVRGPLAPHHLQVVGGPLLTKLMWINVSLAVFNLLPALPMDGGRVLRAVLALRLTRDRATVVAATIAQGLAILLGFAGFLFQPMLVLIALFVWMGAKAESLGVEVRNALASIAVADAMVTEFRVLASGDSVRRAAELTVGGFQADFPVVNEGRAVGVLTRVDVLKAVASGRADATVEAFMHTEFPVATPGETMPGVLEKLQTSGLPVLVIEDGRLVGLFTSETVAEVLTLGRAMRKGTRSTGTSAPYVKEESEGA